MSNLGIIKHKQTYIYLGRFYRVVVKMTALVQSDPVCYMEYVHLHTDV
jgi:hypothetical protein